MQVKIPTPKEIKAVQKVEHLEAIERLEANPDFRVFREVVLAQIAAQNSKELLNFTPSTNARLDAYNQGFANGFYKLSILLGTLPTFAKAEREARNTKAKKDI